METFLNRLTLRVHTANRLTMLSAVISLLLLLIAGFGAWRIRNLQAHSEKLLSNNVASVRAAVELELHIQELRHQLDRYLWLHDAGRLDPESVADLREMQSERQEIAHWLQRAESSADTPEEQNGIDELRAALGQFFKQFDALTEEGQADASRASLAAAAQDTLEEKVLLLAENLLKIDEKLLERSRLDAQIQSSRLASTLLLLGGSGALAALLAGYALARTISRSLLELRLPIQAVAGKLSEVGDNLVISTTLDLNDLRPAIERLLKEVTTIVELLHEQQREIVHADQLASVGQLAAGIAHEIRNPLMAMKMLVQAARRQDTSLDPRDMQILDDEIRRLEVLLAEFLDFARPKPLQKTMVDLGALMDSTVTFLQRQADARRVQLECEYPTEPVLLLVDSPRIRQVLVNLVLNGIEATEAGGTVELKLEVDESVQNQMCRIVVTDNGQGIAEDQRPKIFDPFYSTKATGLGLGLAISQRIIRSHGGELSHSHTENGGATFTIELPGPDSNSSLELAPPSGRLQS